MSVSFAINYTFFDAFEIFLGNIVIKKFLELCFSMKSYKDATYFWKLKFVF